MDKLRFKQWSHSLQTKSTLAIVITAGLLIEITSAVQYWFASKGIAEEVQHRAESELLVKTLEIRKLMTAVEAAVNNMVWVVEQQLDKPDSMYTIGRHLVETNDVIVGCPIAFEPNYYPSKGTYFEPYVVRHADGRIEEKQIGSETHQYWTSEWYSATVANGTGHWSEPYYDDAGALMMLCTYAVPLHDKAGAIVGVLAADVSLDWLGSVINDRPIYPSSYNLIVSRTGQLIACPVDSLIMRTNIQDATRSMTDTSVNSVNKRMLAGQSGKATVYDNEGNKNYVFFAPVDTNGESIGWSMAVVCSDYEIYHSLRQVRFNLLLLMFVGLGLLLYIIFRTLHSFKKLEQVNAEKERMGSELKIAHGIQMSMLPKIYPPYPERDDIEIFGSLAPAKEVCGDLYDFFIRDEKLFICIGDVSGKGVPASLVMAVTRSMFRTVSSHESSPERIISQMSHSMSDMNETNMFVTLFVAVLDLPTGRMRYCNAGHDAPILIGRGVGMLPVESNIPVGVLADWSFKGQEAVIYPSTTMFFFTDGLTEAENVHHEQFSERRILDVAKKARAEGKNGAQSLISMMTEAVEQFVGNAEQSDDLTMLAINYSKKMREDTLERTIVLPNDVNEVPRLSAFVDEVCEALSFDMAATMQMNLAIEEAVVNVMTYAYPKGTVGNVTIKAQANEVRLKFVITDEGVPFDPTAKADVDTSLSVEERPIGGLGIFLVRQLMDSINYERVDGCNVLTLRKTLSLPPAPLQERGGDR